MIEFKYGLVAEGVSQDKDSGSLSVFNILEAIAASGYPLLLQKLSFLSVWSRLDSDPSEVSGKFTVRFGQSELVSSVVRFNFGDKMRHRALIHLGGLVVPGIGALRFRIDLESGASCEYQVEMMSSTEVSQPGA
jgi:hypothetical protein